MVDIDESESSSKDFLSSQNEGDVEESAGDLTSQSGIESPSALEDAQVTSPRQPPAAAQ